MITTSDKCKSKCSANANDQQSARGCREIQLAGNPQESKQHGEYGCVCIHNTGTPTTEKQTSSPRPQNTNATFTTRKKGQSWRTYVTKNQDEGEAGVPNRDIMNIASGAQ